MKQLTLGERIRKSRKQLAMTQAELAEKCNLDIRTIQRIEQGDVNPRAYTLRMISAVPGMEISLPADDQMADEELKRCRKAFQNRKKIRIFTFVTAIGLMLAIAVLGFPTWVIFGMPKQVWAPYFYLLMFGHIIGIALTWRCPGCNSILGDVFKTRYCSKCGLKFID